MDFAPADLQTDLENITSPTYGGEGFFLGGSSVTYYGVFGQTDMRYAFTPCGHSEDSVNAVVFSRGVPTPSIDMTILRHFDATTYRILQRKPDLQAWECALETIR